jgi:uncharacterized membrane protein (DUF106 family)
LTPISPLINQKELEKWQKTYLVLADYLEVDQAANQRDNKSLTQYQEQRMTTLSSF